MGIFLPVKRNHRQCLSVLGKWIARNMKTIFYRGKPGSLGSNVVKEEVSQV